MNKGKKFFSLNNPQSLPKAMEILQAGGLIAFPTDTVYGIGALYNNEDAIEKIYQVKVRSKIKAIPILISDTNQLTLITSIISPNTHRIINEFWPGPLTLILPIQPNLPGILSDGVTIGIRVPDHDLVRELIRVTGPLAVTSANLSGKSSALTADDVMNQLEDKIDLILDGGRVPGGKASTVLNCIDDKMKILREGPILWEEIEAVIND